MKSPTPHGLRPFWLATRLSRGLSDGSAAVFFLGGLRRNPKGNARVQLGCKTLGGTTIENGDIMRARVVPSGTH
jgi:hypothetical protein